jgi:hypothetical protein
LNVNFRGDIANHADELTWWQKWINL